MSMKKSGKQAKNGGHRIREVEPGSIADQLGLSPGDFLLSVNGESLADVFDYRFAIAEEVLAVGIRRADGEEWILDIEKDPGEDLGLSFESDLMDDYRSCRNRCIFCFIDQMPPGMRETLYFKDDDSRLSFLQGNYITLTNTSEADIDRVIRFHMEPINISVHTTNPDLRVKMLGNRHAGEIFPTVRRLADAGIRMNGQIVLCKGINDGEELERSLRDLSAYLPAFRSVSVVPVGLTRYRDGLPFLENFTAEDAEKVLSQIHRLQEEFRANFGTRFVYASDEWYLLAGQPLPMEEEYEGYPQIENGVGMLRSLSCEVDAALEKAKSATGIPKKRRSLATGELAAPFIKEIVGRVRAACPDLDVEVRAIRNRFFGDMITVAGLLTGKDIIEQLAGEDLGERLLLPCQLLRSGEEVLLDDVSVSDIENSLGLPVMIVGESGGDLLSALLDEKPGGTAQRRQSYEQAYRGDRGAAERR